MFMPSPGPAGRLNIKLLKHYKMYEMLAHDLKHGTRTGIKWYEDHNEEVKRAVPKGNLLIFNAKQGWEPLCNFLGKEIPAEEFPRKNTMSDW